MYVSTAPLTDSRSTIGKEHSPDNQDTIVALWDTKLANLKIQIQIVESLLLLTPTHLYTVVPEMSSCWYHYDLSLPSLLLTPPF